MSVYILAASPVPVQQQNKSNQEQEPQKKSQSQQPSYHYSNSPILDSLNLSFPYFTLKKFRLGSFRLAKSMANNVDEKKRLDQIPVLHVRGTFYVCGYTIGRQFRNIIEDLLTKWDYFNSVLLPLYATPEGRHKYDQSLHLCSQKFPQYVKELEGMADGAKVPFFKLFLLHIDTLIDPYKDDAYSKMKGETGCTSVMSNSDEVILGHTEDALPEFLNNVYIVSAEITDENGGKLEKFTTLTYAGHLPGYTMGFNEHGLVYSINTIFVKNTFPNRTPRMFLTRALLGASNFVAALDILRDVGTGTSDGFSLNITFAKQEGTPVMHNVEVGPSSDTYSQSSMDKRAESELSVLTLTHGDFHAHCNKYLRLRIPEIPGIALDSSNHRHKAIGRHLRANTAERIKEVLSDQSDLDFPVFRCGQKKPDSVKTVAVGLFDILNRKWSIYMDPPQRASPVATIHMDF